MKKYVKSLGFTLVEMLVVVLIIGILASIAIPNYARSIEKSRATEAMNMIKAVNDAIYAYAAEKNDCPASFSKILVEIPGDKVSDVMIRGKYFTYVLNGASNSPIPGTVCPGLLAERNNGDVYRIWNPYRTVNGKRSLACNGDNDRAQKVCKSMGILVTDQP